VLRRRQREVHHGPVEDDHENAGADDGEDQPPPWVRIADVGDVPETDVTETDVTETSACHIGR
jgi:hypothetical protein